MKGNDIDLVSLFDTLSVPKTSASSGVMSACSLPGFEHYRLAKDIDGNAVLLIWVRASGSEPPPAGFALRHLSIQHNVECRVIHRGGSLEEGRFTIIKCMDADPSMRSYFLRVLGSVVLLIGAYPSRTELIGGINKLVELFRLMTEPGRGPTQGLWAELLLIEVSSDPVLMIDAWHRTATDIFDFNSGNQRIEVKSAGGRNRTHHFALEQLRPPSGTSALVASILVEPAGAGYSLCDLTDMISARLAKNADLAARLHEGVGLAIGDGWRQAFDLRFDYEMARASLLLFDSRDIPSVEPNIPTRVSSVHFIVDMEGLTPLTREQLRDSGGLFGAMSTTI